MLNKFFIFFVISVNISCLSYIDEVNLYKKILYPSIKFKIKEEYLKKNDYKQEQEIEGSYFSTNNNEYFISKLQDYYLCHKKLFNLIKSNSIKIDDYDCKLLILNEYKKKINFENVSINKIENTWFNKIIKYENLNNKHKIEGIKLVNSRKYIINLTNKEFNLLKKNININYLVYLLENINILNDILCVFSPFDGNRISPQELTNILKKQIIVYIYNNIYKNY
jgi:hypothetical protein